LDYRPRFYFGPQDLKRFYKSRILGQMRGKMVSEEIDSGDCPPELMESSLSQQLRTSVGLIHPQMMGGEFLPDFHPKEVELCRVVLDSATMDVFSLRVRKQKYRYAYRLEDEYSNHYILSRKTSTHPLTMGQIIEVLDTCRCIVEGTGEEEDAVGLVRCFTEQVLDIDPDAEMEAVLGFVTVESSFYPEIEEYYEDKKRMWYEEIKRSLNKE
jgi:hypothetical protein